MVSITLAPEYGYVLAVPVATVFVNFWLSSCVMKARKKYSVPYPKLYDEKSTIFNCYQRAHQNFLETTTMYLIITLIAGLENPVLAAIGGFISLAGRVAYALGYQTGDPQKRVRGAFGYIGLLISLWLTLKLIHALLTAAN